MAEGGVGVSFDKFNCSICLEKFRNPKLLPCHHSFCRHCLEDYVDRTSANNQFECPLCRSVAIVPEKGLEGFQTNFYVDDEEDRERTQPGEFLACDLCGPAVKATHFCEECDIHLCSICTNGHMKIKATRSHTLVQVSGADSTERKKVVRVFCRKHPEEEVKVVCVQCDQVLCYVCKVSEHDTHTSKELSTRAKELRDELTSALNDAKFSEKKSVLNDNIASLKQCNGKLNSALQQEIKVIQEQGQMVIEKVNALVKERKADLSACYQKAIKENEIKVEQCSSYLDELVSLEISAKECLENYNDTQVVEKVKDVCSKTRTQVSKSIDRIELEISTLTKSCQISECQLSTMINAIDERSPVTLKALQVSSRQMRSVKKAAKKYKAFQSKDKNSETGSLSVRQFPQSPVLTSEFKVGDSGSLSGLAVIGQNKAWISSGRTVRLRNSSGQTIHYNEIYFDCVGIAAVEDGGCVCAGEYDTQPIKTTLKCIQNLDLSVHESIFGIACTTQVCCLGIQCLHFGLLKSCKIRIFDLNSGSSYVLQQAPNFSCFSAHPKHGIVVCRSHQFILEVNVYTLEGKLISSSSRSKKIMAPRDVCFDNSGCVVISRKGAVERLTPDGNFMNLLTIDASYIDVDADNNLWVTLFDGTIRIYNL